MNAEQVRALVAARFPGALDSPLASACLAFAAADEADRAVQFADLLARATVAEKRMLRAEALDHAEACLRVCDGWVVETLGHNIESTFGPDLSADECDEIARKALGL